MIECKYSHFDKMAAQHFTANVTMRPYGTLRSALLHCLRNVDRQFFTKCKYLHSLPKFCSKIEILIKNRNFGQKSKFWSKIKILVKNRNFGQKLKFLLND